MQQQSSLFNAQFKASSTQTLEVQLIDAENRLVPFDPAGNATGTLTFTTSWQTFQQLWLAEARLGDLSLTESDYDRHVKGRIGAGESGYRVVGIRPIVCRGLTAPVQVRLGGLVDDDVKTYTNGDYFGFGHVPYELLAKPRGVFGRDVQVAHVTDNALHAANEVVVAKAAITDLMRDIDAEGYLSKHTIVDIGQSISDFDLQVDYWSNDSDVGAANAAFAPSDAEWLEWLGGYTIESTEWRDGNGAHTVTLGLGDQRMGLHLKPKTGTRTVYVTYRTVSTPTPTTTSDLKSIYSVVDA